MRLSHDPTSDRELASLVELLGHFLLLTLATSHSPPSRQSSDAARPGLPVQRVSLSPPRPWNAASRRAGSIGGGAATRLRELLADAESWRLRVLSEAPVLARRVLRRRVVLFSACRIALPCSSPRSFFDGRAHLAVCGKRTGCLTSVAVGLAAP